MDGAENDPDGRKPGKDLQAPLVAYKTGAGALAYEGRVYRDGGFVFTHPNGRWYHPERFSREFDRPVERQGLKRIRLHDLRHSWGTVALKAVVHVKVVSERLGHASSVITSDTYSHVSPAMASDAAEQVANLIFGA